METIFVAVCVGVSFIFLGIRNDAGLLASRLLSVSVFCVSQVTESERTKEREKNGLNDLDS
jgi:hypothetical protein